MSKYLLKNPICSICGTNKVKVVNKHLFSCVVCDDCEHSYILMEQKNHDKLTKNKNRNALENSFCPYWTMMQNLDKIKKFQIELKNESACQCFSKKSLQRFMENLDIPFSIEISGEVAVVSIR